MRNLKRASAFLLAFLLTGMMSLTAFAAVEDTGFFDVDATAWYVGAVEYCQERGWMAGTSATTFSPEETLTHAQLVTVLYRVEGEPAVTGDDSFTDTESGRWYSSAALWASQRGLVNGYGNGLFGTNDPVTQEHLTLIFQRYTVAAVTEGIPDFDGSRAPATRAQTAAVLMAYAQSQGQRPAQGEADNMVLLPGGTFTMGSPDSERLREADETAHQVTVSSFYIAPYEVTQADYERIMGTNPSHFNGANLPVDSVTWYDTIEYCNKLSERRGLTPVYTVNGQSVSWNRVANGYRLPTKAEWEYAARGGTTSEFYTGGFISAEEANYYINYLYLIEENYVNHTNPHVVTGVYRNTTAQGNTLAPNGFQLYNMLGNVSEWVFDCYGEYDLTNAANPTGAESGHLRVNRGGAYNDFAKHLRCAYRSAANPVSSDQNLGFRIARNAAPGQGTVQAVYDLNITIPNNPKILVAYFSSSGNTENAAQIIQQKMGGDLFEIEMANPYTGALYQQSQQDLYAGTRPALRTHVENMDQYDVVLLGYPTWWATIPMPVVSFLEEYDFSGKTIINFSSHGGGRFGESVSLLSKEVPDAYVGFGFHYSGGSTLSDENSHWLGQNGISEIS